jgi:hypothetical protein
LADLCVLEVDALTKAAGVTGSPGNGETAGHDGKGAELQPGTAAVEGN